MGPYCKNCFFGPQLGENSLFHTNSSVLVSAPTKSILKISKNLFALVVADQLFPTKMSTVLLEVFFHKDISTSTIFKTNKGGVVRNCGGKQNVSIYFGGCCTCLGFLTLDSFIHIRILYAVYIPPRLPAFCTLKKPVGHTNPFHRKFVGETQAPKETTESLSS